MVLEASKHLPRLVLRILTLGILVITGVIAINLTMVCVLQRRNLARNERSELTNISALRQDERELMAPFCTRDTRRFHHPFYCPLANWKDLSYCHSTINMLRTG